MRLLIAGGGTGGHLFPALAIAKAVSDLDPDGSVLFVGTRHGIEARVLPTAGFPIRFITARGMRKTGFLNRLWASLEIPVGMCQSFAIMRDFRPSVVLGVGGYASGPTLAAAVLERIPTAIQEQNSVMGTTNRLLCRFVDRVFTSWETTQPEPPKEKTLCLGNPIRESLLQGDAWKGNPRELKVLVFGGSAGAKSINQAVAGNLDMLKPFCSRMKIVHQTGRGSAEPIKRQYKAAGIEADVCEFIEEMGSALKWADLVVCRSGASSLAEITALGKAAIVVPYPYAIGDHQTLNARVLESAGAVTIVPDHRLKNGALVDQMRFLLENPTKLAEMGRRSAEFGKPDAARTIACEILKMERKSP